MTALWIILAVVALLGLSLLLPLRIALRYDPESGFFYRVRLWFVTLAASDRQRKSTPRKAATPAAEKAPQKKSSAASDLLSLLGLGEVSTAERAKAAIAERGLAAVLSDVISAVRLLLSQTGRCLGAGVFQRFEFTVVIGGDDAADASVSYGVACAAVYSLVTLLEQSMTLRRRRVSVEIDYARDDSRIRLDLLLRYRLWHLVRYACFLLGNYIKKSRKEQKTS